MTRFTIPHKRGGTPTDDEREALMDMCCTVSEVDAILAAGFRRTEVPEPSGDGRIGRAIDMLSWQPDHDGGDAARVRDDYMRRAQAADAALAILTENREGAF